MIDTSVQLVKNKKFISDALSLDRVWASEAFMSLDNDIWPLAKWYLSRKGRDIGLLLLFDQVTPTPAFIHGKSNCIASILKKPGLPTSIIVDSPITSVGLLKEHYHFDSAVIMVKMQLEHFRDSSPDSRVRRLVKEDFPMARDLFHRNVEDGHFDRDQFIKGVYFGIQKGADLLAMAGTTVLCKDFSTATIGNVITDTDSRGQGYAVNVVNKLCSYLRSELFDCITIKTSRGNSAAITLYRKLGFVKKCEYFEGIGEKVKRAKYGDL